MWVRGKHLKQRRGRPKTRGQSGGKVKKISGKSENFEVLRGTYPIIIIIIIIIYES